MVVVEVGVGRSILATGLDLVMLDCEYFVDWFVRRFLRYGGCILGGRVGLAGGVSWDFIVIA